MIHSSLISYHRIITNSCILSTQVLLLLYSYYTINSCTLLTLIHFAIPIVLVTIRFGKQKFLPLSTGYSRNSMRHMCQMCSYMSVCKTCAHLFAGCYKEIICWMGGGRLGLFLFC